MNIYKAYKFRLYLDKDQRELVNKTLGCNRFIYNYYLNKSTEEYKNNKTSFKAKESIKNLITLYPEYPWLKEVDSMSLRTTIFDLEDSYKNFYRTKNYPKYKSKYEKNSYRTNLITSSYKENNYENIKVDMINKTIKLPKMKEAKIRGYRKTQEIKGRIINATVTKERNKYYVSVLYEQTIEEPKVIPQTIVGIDLGVKDLVITSYGEKLTNEKAIKKYENKIKNLQKWLSKKEKGSKNYYKVKDKLKEVYEKLRNARKYAIHKITKQLTEENDIIVTEKLQVKKLIETKEMSKYIQDASLSEITRQLEYKSKWKNKKYYQVETYYPSSQLCNKCGNQNKETKDIKVRKWTCEKCLNEHDRDINAAINIMSRGLEKYVKEVSQGI